MRIATQLKAGQNVLHAQAGGSTSQKAKNYKPIVTDPRVDNEVREKLITARIGLFLKHPFFGNLATRLTMENADEWCPTAATDGRKFYYNTQFINKLSPRKLEFLFAHEVLHVIYDHMGRRGDRDPQLWNVADDYCVNGDLIQHRIGEPITEVQILHDQKYYGWSAEEVYEDLMKNAQKINLEQLINRVIDEHLDGDGDGDGDGDEKDENGNPKEGGSKGRPKLSEEEKKAIKDEIRQAVLEAAQSVGADNLPGGIKRMLKDLTEPKMDWRELLRQSIESMFKSDFTWARPSRRGWHQDAIMPGMKPGEKIELFVAIDTSGSIGDEQTKDFLSEIKGIMDQFEEYKIKVWCFDTAVHNPQDFTSENCEDIAGYELAGFGGTDFEVNWEFMKEHGFEPEKFVMFTDGYPGGGWGDENYCDTLWVLHGNPQGEAPFGITTHYEKYKG